MSRENWKLEKDLCRCCLSEGSFKNLAEPCFNQGEEEVYCEMLLESLDINLVPVSGPLCSSTYTICEECILRLREACSFRRQVLLSEKRFRDLYKRDIIELHLKEEAPDSDNEGLVKFEVPKNEDDDFQMNYDDDDADNKSTIEIEVPQAKKPKPKKPKAKEKPKQPKKRTGRPRKVETKTEAEAKAEAEAKVEAEAGAEAETVKHKETLPVLEKGDYRVVEGGGRLRYGCVRCGAVVNSRHSVRAHIATRHLRREPYRCPLCRQGFKHRSSTAHHLAKKHGMVQVRVDGGTELKPAENRACDVCRKEFASKTLLRRHMITHRRPKCPECGEEFGKDELAIHRSKAHGVAIPTCGVCGYQNSMEYRIITHQRKVHLMEKNLQCPQCEMKFYDKMDLTKHLVRHNPVRNHACSYCNKKFPRASALRLHERIHTGDKRQVCGVCGERFVQKSSLNYHLAKRHPEAQDTPSPSSSQAKDVST